jgi:hypothetical protein
VVVDVVDARVKLALARARVAAFERVGETIVAVEGRWWWWKVSRGLVRWPWGVGCLRVKQTSGL